MTINVVCRRDAINRNRLAPLALVFTHDRRRKFVGLGISEALVHWDFDKQQPTADCPDRAEIQFQITSKIREYEKKIKKLEVLEIPVTFDTLFEQNGKRINCTVGEYFKQIIERLEKVEKYSSASKHKVTLVLVSQFRSVNMRFDELDLTYLREFEIFLSQKGNVNNSCNYAAFQYCRLYLIEILHQTTTHCKCIQFTLCCILSKFYIKPQHEPLASHIPRCCILSKFYIKPQLRCILGYTALGCILSKFYIKPQLPVALLRYVVVVSYRNSTSNHNSGTTTPNSALVVSYRNSTSNHNQNTRSIGRSIVVSYRNFTSNHNRGRTLCGICELYLIEILHQTTTNRPHVKRFRRLYLIEILHQTTTPSSLTYSARPLYLIEILHQTTTTVAFSVATACCILSKFYIKPQLKAIKYPKFGGCILSKFYIKPQRVNDVYQERQLYLIEILHQTTTSGRILRPILMLYLIEILHQTTTLLRRIQAQPLLYLIEILHQTTTKTDLNGYATQLYLIEILHQTTTCGGQKQRTSGCILSKFYIKPQQEVIR